MTRSKRQPRPCGILCTALLSLALAAPMTRAEPAPTATPPTTATAPTTAAAATPAASAPNPADELICKRVRETGSNISRKVCRTRAQIEAESESATDVLERSRRGANGGRLGEGG